MKTNGTTKAARRTLQETYSSAQERWQAVLHRDAEADGQFCYSVKSTGVYCRPSCGSRGARRENVQFHDSWAEAERAGFRACKRCRPNTGGAESFRAKMITTACRMIEAAENPPGLNTLAKSAGMSPFHFQRIFKKTIGLTPKQYAKAQRAQRVRGELAKRKTVTEAIYEAGFNSNGRFYAEATHILGMAPKRFRSGGTGTTIRFAVGKCSLGSILVASSEKGVCAIFLGDDPNQLVQDLQRRFHQARLIAGDRAFKQLISQVVSFVEKPIRAWSLPLDVRGTAFQQRVWEALRAIPTGSTASYAEIAERIGEPQAVRAVAGACAANPIAVAIPCHRVVRSDGSLSGYRWGVERKRQLLQNEKHQPG